MTLTDWKLKRQQPWPKNVKKNVTQAIEGWVVFVTGINEEATEEDVHDRFADYGKVRNICINLDHRTGFVKGYALVEYGTLKEAQNAIDCLDGTKLLDSVIHCEFAFIRASSHQRK